MGGGVGVKIARVIYDDPPDENLFLRGFERGPLTSSQYQTRPFVPILLCTCRASTKYSAPPLRSANGSKGLAICTNQSAGAA